jgi:hypothetical protein
VLGVPDDVGDLELAMAFLQAGLTNQCRRMSWLESSHPALAPDLGSATIDVLRMMVPGFRSVELPAVDVLWATRCFRMPTTSDPVPQRVLVPLVDLLNHHRDGAAGSLRDQSFDVNTRRPFGTPECALTYGMSRDALEMATVYGFADASVTWAHSAPMAFDLDGLVVRVDGVTRTSSGQPVELSTLADDSGLVVRGLTFERGALGATITRLSDQTGLSPEAARSIIGHVLRENLDMTDVLISQCGAHDTLAAATISTAAAIHGGILSSAMEADPIP